MGLQNLKEEWLGVGGPIIESDRDNLVAERLDHIINPKIPVPGLNDPKDESGVFDWYQGGCLDEDWQETNCDCKATQRFDSCKPGEDNCHVDTIISCNVDGAVCVGLYQTPIFPNGVSSRRRQEEGEGLRAPTTPGRRLQDAEIFFKARVPLWRTAQNRGSGSASGSASASGSGSVSGSGGFVSGSGYFDE